MTAGIRGSLTETSAAGGGLEPRLLTAASALARRWRYQGGRRDVRLDLLRGFSAFAMVVDHVGGRDSWLYALTGGNRFMVSAAEAFVLISGVVLGIVYRGVVQNRGVVAALMKALHRAWMLYVTTVLLTFAFAALSGLMGLPWAPDLDEGVRRFAIEVATLHRTYFLADILLMYTLLLLIAGPVVLLLSQGHTAVVLAGSWLVWGLWQYAPGASTVFWDIQGNEVFNLSAWQVIFVTGIVIGWHRGAVETWLARAPRALTRAGMALAVAAVAALLVAQLARLEVLQSSDLLWTYAFDKPDLVIGRLLVLALLAIVAFAVTTALWAPINRATGWLLVPLGQHALAAYALHLFVVAALVKVATTVLADVSDRAWVTATLQLGGVLIVWLAVRFEPAMHVIVQQLVPRALWNPLASAGAIRDGAGGPGA
jgi:hypothetical protein